MSVTISLCVWLDMSVRSAYIIHMSTHTVYGQADAIAFLMHAGFTSDDANGTVSAMMFASGDKCVSPFETADERKERMTFAALTEANLISWADALADVI